MAEAANSVKTLHSSYKRVLTILDELDKADSTSSDSSQNLVEEGVNICEESVRMVNDLDLYSSNEGIEEIATADIKYLLLPAFMGHLTGLNMKQAREGILQKSKVYFSHFLRLCNQYSIPGVPNLPEAEELEEQPNSNRLASKPARGLVGMAADRNSKLARYKEQQQTKAQLTELEKYVSQEHVDDETQRKYYFTLLKKWGLTAFEELDAIEQELGVLEYMKQRGAGHPVPEKPKAKAPSTFILARTAAQKAVFGLGYPSLPTYTVEEWYDQQVAEGRMPAPGTAAAPHMPTEEEEAAAEEQRQAEEERLEETDDREHLMKKRNWDDFKDDTRRGSGNSKNKG